MERVPEKAERDVNQKELRTGKKSQRWSEGEDTKQYQTERTEEVPEPALSNHELK